MADVAVRDIAMELVLRIKRGVAEKESLRQLCALYLPSVDLFFLRQNVGQKDRQDLTQNVFLRVCKDIGSLREAERFEGWLFTIARHVFLTYIVQERVHARQQLSLEDVLVPTENSPRFEEKLADPGANPLEDLLQQEELDVLREACELLPDQQRRCLELRMTGLSYEAIATLLGIQVETVRSHLYEARKSLRTAGSGAPGIAGHRRA